MRIILIILLALALLGGKPAPAADVTSYARMVSELQGDAAHCPALRLVSLGKSAGGHRDLWLVRAADLDAKTAGNIRLLILCRQHGDEPASTEAALRLLHGLVSGDSRLLADLSHVTLYLVPMVNPDGAEANTRENGAGVDLNRDWGVFSQPETRAIARAVAAIHPQIILDAHNWDGGDHYDADCLEVARTGDAPMVDATRALQANAVSRLADSGYQVAATSYGPEADPHLAHRYWTSRGLIACLVETHSGDPRDTADFQLRQGMYIALIHGLAHHYAAQYSRERLCLAHLEGSRAAETEETRFFPPIREIKTPASAVRHKPAPVWLWPLCAFSLALWASGFRSLPNAAHGTATARRPASAPASGRRSAARPGRPRYQY